MRRRNMIQEAAALTAASLACPNIVAAQASWVLKFVPQADLALLDPTQTTAFVTCNHALSVFDTLYGVDAQWKPQP